MRGNHRVREGGGESPGKRYHYRTDRAGELPGKTYPVAGWTRVFLRVCDGYMRNKNRGESPGKLCPGTRALPDDSKGW